MNRVLQGPIGSNKVLLGLTGSYQVLPGPTGSYPVLLGLTGSYMVLPVASGSFGVFLTGSYLVFLFDGAFICTLKEVERSPIKGIFTDLAPLG